ncbi:adenylate kinase [Dyadobacter sp. LJ53]|uniref:adenylate kinase n=1 Tax=Dyadobacter chenwenxiniae TaxID=2906456 RepID=UPI001F370F1C|nr:adenylate kinase [Dyadobacter chenwenxiniae]MCF0049102.1 adenylate kinase [Dyadobacter chenwenxiniae]
MKIHIMGASCAGSTTLGMALSELLAIPYFDTDLFFWEQSDIPYTVKRDPLIRNKMLSESLSALDHYIVGGSLIGWGEEWQKIFDLVVFLYVPQQVRLQRLVNRERERYGEVIYTDPHRNRLFKAFYSWASGYDDPLFTGRNVKIHEEWISKLSCRVIEIRGDTTTNERLKLIYDHI